MNFQFTKLPKKAFIDLCRSNLTSREIRVFTFCGRKDPWLAKMETRLAKLTSLRLQISILSYIQNYQILLASKGYLQR